jgi:hypothetical protein
LAFVNDDAIFKLLDLVVRNASEKWTAGSAMGEGFKPVWYFLGNERFPYQIFFIPILTGSNPKLPRLPWKFTRTGRNEQNRHQK